MQLVLSGTCAALITKLPNMTLSVNSLRSFAIKGLEDSPLLIQFTVASLSQ